MADTRSIDLNSLDVLQNKVVFPTSNEKHVLAQEYETIIREPEYRLLGFLNNYSYSAASGYLTRYRSRVFFRRFNFRVFYM